MGDETELITWNQNNLFHLPVIPVAFTNRHNPFPLNNVSEMECVTLYPNKSQTSVRTRQKTLGTDKGCSSFVILDTFVEGSANGVDISFITLLSIEWNSIRLGGPAHGIVTKTVHKTLSE